MIRGRQQFLDIPYYKPVNGALPKRVVLVSPHENEHQVTLPFQTALKNKLLTENIMVEEKVILGMMKRGWSIRRHILSSFNDHPDANEAAKLVLALEDSLIRIRVMWNSLIVNDNKNTFFLEMHGDFNRKDDEIFNDTDVKRIENTRFLIREFQHFVDYCSRLGKKLELEEIIPWEISGLIVEFSKIRGFDLGEALNEVKVKLGEIARLEKIIRTIEIPGDVKILDREHPAFNLYYENDGGHIRTKQGITNFEELYCSVFRTSICFTQQDIDAVASLLLIPEK